MRFHVTWFDADGFAGYSEHFEHSNIEAATKYLAMRLASYRVEPGIRGYILNYADSEFLRKHTVKPGGPKSTRSERCENELACKNYPHLLRET